MPAKKIIRELRQVVLGKNCSTMVSIPCSCFELSKNWNTDEPSFFNKYFRAQSDYEVSSPFYLISLILVLNTKKFDEQLDNMKKFDLFKKGPIGVTIKIPNLYFSGLMYS